jgi:hypothetical protein
MVDVESQEKNKALVIKAWDTLFNQRDYVAAEHYWSPNYIQHASYIEPGREGLFNFIKSLPPTVKYEPGIIVADGDFVIIHGRFSGFGKHMASHQERGSGRALGCSSRRGHPGAVKESPSNVRGQVSEYFGENDVGVKNL